LHLSHGSRINFHKLVTTTLPSDTTFTPLESKLTINDHAYNSTQSPSPHFTVHGMQTCRRVCTVQWLGFRALRVGVGCSINLEVISITSLLLPAVQRLRRRTPIFTWTFQVNSVMMSTDGHR